MIVWVLQNNIIKTINNQIKQKVMNKKQSEFLQSCIDNSVYHIQRLDELKKSGVKLSKTEKYDWEYYIIKRTIISNLKNQLQTIK